MAAAMQRVSTGTGYKDLAEMSQTLAEASDGNVATAGAVAGWANFQTKKVGRNDLAPGAGKLGNLVKGEMGVNGVSRPTADSYIDAGYEARESLILLHHRPAISGKNFRMKNMPKYARQYFGKR